jgi:transcriptional regulator GlxA family with amidase domain
MIDVGVFDQITEPRPGHTLHLDSHAPVSARAASTWVRTWGLVTDITRDTAPAVPDLVVGQMSRMLATVTLAAFPNNAVVEPDFRDRHDAHPAAVTRAISLIEANPDLDLTVVDIARAAHVSTRALQLGFRRSLDTTPMAYLRRVRLEHARAELVAAVPGDDTTVTAVAARWGWARASRFAASYRAAYGRHPSDDLGRSSSLVGR